MIQRRTPSENVEVVNSMSSRNITQTSKVTVKEKKAAKRKEKSRVAAQIRRNKESQTLILLQNALPLALPSPSLMLEKSIVIRIAGQTLFLMNTLDQVLGIDGWLTIPLISNNFLTFFMDSAGQIVYASPNIQLLLEQYHWSNLIGMSIYDVIDFKCRWPTVGEVVRMKLSTSSAIPNDLTSFVPSCSSSSLSSNIQSNCSRTTIASRLNLKKSSQAWNNSSSTCSLYNVWCYTNINHTNYKLKLLVLQSIQIKSSILGTINSHHESCKQVILSNNPMPMPIERSISWPPMSNQLIIDESNPLHCTINQSDNSSDLDNTSSKCIYHKMITSAHDRYYNFKSASAEFCQLIGEMPSALAGMNFLDTIHLEDVIKVKSSLDLIFDNNDSHIWTPIYRIMGRNDQQLVVRTIAKQYSAASSYSLILNHVLIESSFAGDPAVALNSMVGSTKMYYKQDAFESGDTDTNTPAKETYLIRSNDPDINPIYKRKARDQRRIIKYEKCPRIVCRALSGPVVYSNSFIDSNQSIKLSPQSPMLQSTARSKLEMEMLNDDPFLPLDLGHVTSRKCTRKEDLNGYGNCQSQSMLRRQSPSHRQSRPRCNRYDPIGARSPSYSLESCVLTSPGSESTDVHIEDQFIWDTNTNFPELSQLNCWLDDQDQNELELILPI